MANTNKNRDNRNPQKDEVANNSTANVDTTATLEQPTEQAPDAQVNDTTTPATSATANGSAEPIEGGMRVTLKRGVTFDLLGDSIEDMMAHVGGVLLPERKVTMPEMLTEIPRLLKGFADRDSLKKTEAMQSAIKSADAELSAIYAEFVKKTVAVVETFNTATGADIAASRLYPASAPTIPTTKSRAASGAGSGVRAASADMKVALVWKDDNGEAQELKFEGKGAVVLLDLIRAMDYDSVVKLAAEPGYGFLSATPKMLDGKVDSTWKPVIRNTDNTPAKGTLWVHTGSNSATKEAQIKRLVATIPGGQVTIS